MTKPQPSTCRICGFKPDVVILPKSQYVTIECSKCLVSTVPRPTLTVALEYWNHINIGEPK